MDNTYYVKKGNKYIPVGIYSLNNDLPDGIWLVHRKPGSTSYHSILSRIKYKFDYFADISSTAEEIEMSELLCEVIRPLLDDKTFIIYNCSIGDFAELLSSKIYDKIREVKEKAGIL